MKRYIVLLGPPGAGKGTQADLINEKLGLAHISSGDLFRVNLKAKTPLGIEAQAYMDRGELVPDLLTIAMVKDRLEQADCAAGALLDGFPRTPAQADALSEMLKDLDGQVVCVPYIAVPADVLIERLSGRWTCRAQGHVYHAVNKPPKTAGICDEDGSELYQRDDDKPETVANRIRVYMAQTAPLIEYYRLRNLLVEVDGMQDIDKVTADLLEAIQKA
jgi:adenylate kinase